MLPSPAYARRLSSLASDPDQARQDLEQGGAILVLSDDGRQFVGVLTRDPELLGEATLAEAISSGNVPPLERMPEEPPKGGGFSRLNRGYTRAFNDLRGWLVRWVLVAAVWLVAVTLLAPASAREVVSAIGLFAVAMLMGFDLLGWKSRDGRGQP
jgi:hypothetical protein